MADETTLLTISSADLAELRGRLAALGNDAPKIVTQMFDDYGRLVVQAIKDEAPVREGVLRESAGYAISGANTSNVELRVFIGNGKRPEIVVKTLLFGSLPHVIRPKKADGVLRFVVGGETVFARKVNHPGTKRDPFFNRALQKTDSARRSIIGKIGALIVEKIER